MLPGVLSRKRWIATAVFAAVCIAGVWLVYGRTLTVPFLFDDEAAISANPSIRSLTPVSGIFRPPAEGSTGGRPLLNASFALNYAFHRDSVGGYHLANIGIHVLAALILFGVVRRTLELPVWGGRFAVSAGWLAAAAALAWALHPVATVSVTYLSQRAESLAGLMYLLSVYCFIRGATAASRRIGWWTLSCGSFLAGLGVKEIVVTAPLLILLYDRTFLSGTFRAALRARIGYYVTLAAGWALLLFSLGSLAQRGVELGGRVAPLAYGATECWAIGRYLQLAFWPSPLVFDYGPKLVEMGASAGIVMAATLLLVGGTIFAAVRHPKAGFPGAWFLVILAPTSSVIPIVFQPVAENRVYLSLAAVTTGLMLGAHRLLGRRAMLPVLLLLVGLASLAAKRNEAFRSELALWQDTAAKRPENARAYDNLGFTRWKSGDAKRAIEEWQTALRLDPGNASAHTNLAAALVLLGRPAEALEHAQAAVARAPTFARAHNALGDALGLSGRADEARPHYETALRLRPTFGQAHFNLANLHATAGRFPEAIEHYAAVTRLSPNIPEVHFRLANALANVGRFDESEKEFKETLRQRPDHAGARQNLAEVLKRTGRPREAIEHYQWLLQRNPGNEALRSALRELEK